MEDDELGIKDNMSEKLIIQTQCNYKLRNFYVYVHRKATDGTIFYVGKGKLKRHLSLHRSRFWYNVAAKYGVISEVVLDNLTEDYAHCLEIEMIKFYGRRDKGEGYLVNVTDGGEGVSGYIYSDEQREAVSRRVSGPKHPCFDHTVYKFINAYTSDVLETTKHNFKNTIGSECGGLFNKSDLHVRGWYLDGWITTYDIEAIRSGYSGKYCIHTDHTIYKFYNLITNETLELNRKDFNTLTNLNPSALINGTCNINGDWTLLDLFIKLGKKFLTGQTKGLNNGRADTTIYTFYNMVTKDSVQSTRFEMEEKIGKSLRDLFTKRGVITMHNWCLIENKDKTANSLKDFTVYEFTHDDGSKFVGTRIQFKAETGICPKNMFSTPTKRGKGWTFSKQ